MTKRLLAVCVAVLWCAAFPHRQQPDFRSVTAGGVDRPVRAALTNGGTLSGSRPLAESLGLDGSGIAIALVDSGVTGWHDDLTGPGGAGQRVVRFVDFVQHRTAPYDDYGHGTHVAGIVAGNGFDSDGDRAGIAPAAAIVALKVLDQDGEGQVEAVVEAIDYTIAHREELNVRVMNLSVAAAPTESYLTDPLTLAARRAVQAGIVVVAAAGNLGRTPDGRPVYGGITSPGNAPWVITVGASDPNGTAATSDDSAAPFSSRGPTRFDGVAKPDLLAPGVGLESLAEAGSTLVTARPQMLLWGTRDTAAPPYFRMSGTSMAAPIVSGTIALMLQANPALAPAMVAAILRETADRRPGPDALTQGAGFLNARAAIERARTVSAEAGALPGSARGAGE